MRATRRRSTRAGGPSSRASRTTRAVLAERRRPFLARPDWPPVANGELVSALDGNGARATATAEQDKARPAPAASRYRGAGAQATPIRVRALMMIRAYRIRGHLQADLDPLGLEPPQNTPSSTRPPTASPRPTTTARSSSTTCSGSRAPPSRRCSTILKRTYCSTLGVEFMHISDPRAEGLDPGAHRGPRQGDRLHRAKASAPSSTS